MTSNEELVERARRCLLFLHPGCEAEVAQLRALGYGAVELCEIWRSAELDP